MIPAITNNFGAMRIVLLLLVVGLPGYCQAQCKPPYPHCSSLTWTASPSSDISGYNVYRGTATGQEGDSPLNGGTLVAGEAFEDDTVTIGSTYYYVVTAVDSVGTESVWSNEAQDTIPGTAPATAFFARND